MPIFTRRRARIEQRLAEARAHAKLKKREAVKRTLERLFQPAAPIAPKPKAWRYVGSDPKQGDVAQHSKRLLRKHFSLRVASCWKA